MINNVLINLAYLFYPKKICSQTEEYEYMESKEHKRLLEIIKHFEMNKSLYFDLEKTFKKDSSLKNIRDMSLFDYKDRALTFHLTVVEEGELFTVTLYLSVLIPFYIIKIQKNKIELIFSEMEIIKMKNEKSDTRKIKELVQDISSLVETTMLYSKFPEGLSDQIIEDISFQEIPFGRFTMFNAFFKN